MTLCQLNNVSKRCPKDTPTSTRFIDEASSSHTESVKVALVWIVCKLNFMLQYQNTAITAYFSQSFFK